jgi:glycosyltransferase involved in cell wall biosynthesis
MVAGGVERVTLHLIEGFKAEGDACLLALGRSRGELLEEAQALVEVRDLASDGLQFFLPRLTNLIRDWQPTHIVTAFSDIGLLAALARRWGRSNAAWVHGVHEMQQRGASRPGVCGLVRYQAYKAMAAWVCRHADLAVAVSEGLAREVRSAYEMPDDRVRAIYNPIIPDTWNHFVAKPNFSSRCNVRIVALGRLSWEKGYDVLLHAMDQVPSDIPWTLEIHGEGPERFRLHALIARLGLGHRICLPGHAADPFAVLEGADLFVLPSRREGLGNVLVEAMACGAQVVASDCRHGPREILEDGRWGQLVPPEDPQALATAIEKVLAGNERREPSQLIARARQFTVSVSYAQWRAALCDVKGGHAQSSI